MLGFTVGHLGFLVFNTTAPDHELEIPQPWERAIPRIWPSVNASITWSPRPALSQEQFVALVDSI